jgi:hypothetical protein
MEHFDYQDPGTVAESPLLGTGLGDLDISGFADGLNGAVGDITAQDDALIAEYGSPADTGLDTWADNLNNTVDATQNQTDAVIWDAEHSPGYDGGITDDGYSPEAAAALNGFNIADGIEASDYQDFEAGLTGDDSDAAIADADAAIGTADD